MHLVINEEHKRRKSILDKELSEEERKHVAAEIITRAFRAHSRSCMKLKEELPRKDRFSTREIEKKGKCKCPLLQNIFYAFVLVLLGGIGMSLFEFQPAEQRIYKSKKELKMVEEFFQHNQTILNFLHEHAAVFDDSTYKNNWKISGGCFYAFTVCTTIGYGNYAPDTVGGKIFTIIYGLLSIPLAGALLVSVAQAALNFFAMLYSMSMNKIDAAFDELDEDGGGFLDREEMRKGLETLEIPISDIKFAELMLVIDKDQDNQIDREEFKLAIELLDADVSSVSTRGAQTKILVSALVFWLLGGTIVFAYSEGWLFYESLYFSIITLLTVGLGDYTPNHNSMGASLFLYFFVLGGLGMLAVFINLLKVIIQKKQEEAMKVLLKSREKKEKERKRKKTVVETMQDNVRRRKSKAAESRESNNEHNKVGVIAAKEIKITVTDDTKVKKAKEVSKSPKISSTDRNESPKSPKSMDFTLPNKRRRSRSRSNSSNSSPKQRHMLNSKKLTPQDKNLTI